jgi:hypothetical protein
MPEAQITNPSGAWGQTATQGSTVRNYNNNSAGTLFPGDVVVFAADVTGANATTTTTVNDKTVLGVVAAKTPSDSGSVQPAGSTYGVGSPMPVVISGVARINIGANTVAAGDLLTTSAVAKVAATNAGTPAANAVTGSIIGVALEASAAKDTATNTIRANITKF